MNMVSSQPFSFPKHTLIGLLVLLLSNYSTAAPIFFKGTGLAGVSAEFAGMQAALGNPLNGNAPGPLGQGRRQINWDAGIVPFDMPRDFFNNPAFPPTRGAVMSSATNEFRVSNDGVDDEFDTFNLLYKDEFTTFSAPRLFSPFDTNVFEVDFFVPASDQPAAVSGFGAIFTDVDLAGQTQIEWFGSAGNLLDTAFVDPDPQGLSFLGAIFDDPVASVRITLGNATLASGVLDGGNNDVVVLDDFIFGEPTAVPEPASLALIGCGLLFLLRAQRKASKQKTNDRYNLT